MEDLGCCDRGGESDAGFGGATRGAGRAIAVEVARAGFYVYATGRSSRTTGPSEIGRRETIEETGDLIAAAGGAGSALVVDHEDPASVGELVSAIEADHGRLDVLVNDIFGGDRYMDWDKPLWEHDWAGGLRMLQMGVYTHLITCRAVLVRSHAPLLRFSAALVADPGDYVLAATAGALLLLGYVAGGSFALARRDVT